jgi:LacI family transcriptional regulator
MSDAPTRARKRATLKVVARAAGVSTATASKVLNHRPDVAAETRERVEAALREHGYERTTGPSDATAVPVVTAVFDTLESIYSTQVLRGILAAALDAGVDIVVEELSVAGGKLSARWISGVARRHRLGVLVVTTALERSSARVFQHEGLPVVAIDPPNIVPDSVVSVASSNFAGGSQAANHLLELGHRRIALANGPATHPTARQRAHGYRSALEAAGIVPEEELMLNGAFTYAAGVMMGGELLERATPPTAIFATSDLGALGVLEAARRAGARVPDDLSVVGYDDTPVAQWSAPPLTTVGQNMRGLGQIALRTLVQQAEGHLSVSHRIELATSLVKRDSTAAPRGAAVEPVG